jgi:outer membrane lipoprotein SlyB
VNGTDERISATTEAVIAGSTRARNLGAIAGGAAAGALIGKAVGDGKNATVGGIIGGATAAGIVAGSKGYQVVLPSGTVMTFTVNETVAMR